jgi:hypothetical protein
MMSSFPNQFLPTLSHTYLLLSGGKNVETTLIHCDRLGDPAGPTLDAIKSESEIDSQDSQDPQGVLRELLLCQSQLCDQITANQSTRRELVTLITEEHLQRSAKLQSVQEKCLLDEYHITYLLQTIRLSLTHGIADVKLPSHETIEAAVHSFRASENAMKEASSALNATRRGGRRKTDAGTTASSSVQPDEAVAVGSEYTVCCVCFDGDSNEDNPIVFCERCNISVHKCCYGIVTIPDDDWFCDFCIYRNSTRSKLAESAPKKKKTGRPLGSERKDAKTTDTSSSHKFKETARQPCALCPLEGGALKAAVDGRFVHVNCALWTPFVKVLELSNMSSILIESDVVSVATGSEVVHLCRVCKKQHGIPKKCSFAGCSEFFHPLCAWFHGLYMRVESFDTSCKLNVYCEVHTPDDVIPPAEKLTEAIKIMSIDASFVVSMDKMMRSALPSVAPSSLSSQVLPFDSSESLSFGEVSSKSETVEEEEEQSLATIKQLQSRALRIRQRVTVQHALRNRARHSEHTRKAKKMRRRLQYIQKKEREARQRAIKEDRYEPGRCAVCFRTNEEVELIQKLSSSKSQKLISTDGQVGISAPSELKMLRCDRCDIDVHQTCYGISAEELQQSIEAFKAKLSERRRKRSALANSSDDDSSDSEPLGAFGHNALHSGWLCRRCADPSDKDKVCWLPVSAYHSVPVILSESHLRKAHPG